MNVRLFQPNADLQPFLLGDGPRFTQNPPQDHENFIIALPEVQFDDALPGQDQRSP